METTELTSADYWESEGNDIRLNPRRNIDASGLPEFLEKECGVRSTVVMATSGSSGGFKFALLSKAALLASAEAVVNHCDIRKEDVWLAGLSDFHVGGLGIFARAHVAGSRVVSLPDFRWQRDGAPFLEAIRQSRATLTSLTPTHLHDLVRAGAAAPESLRGVLLGGGAIDRDLVARARELGWPTWPSYGMTEACSQVATSVDGTADWLPILPHWECEATTGGRLKIRGNALFSGYASRGSGGWKLDSAVDENGWFVTGDRCELAEQTLRFLDRADDLVKVSGELVSLSSIESTARKVGAAVGLELAVVALPDERRGTEIAVVAEAGGEGLLDRINDDLEGIETVRRIVPVSALPRTDIGKIDREALRRLVIESPD